MSIYYTVDQVAELINLHPKTLQRYIREGKLKATKLGKSYRITGHDLSAFTEGTRFDTLSNHEILIPPKLKSNRKPAMVSSVVDIPVLSKDESIRIANMMTALLNAQTQRESPASLTAQFLESEGVLRLMIWGNLDLAEGLLSHLKQLLDQYQISNDSLTQL